MNRSPLFWMGITIIGLGILIILNPDLLAYIVAFVLIMFGISLINWDRARRMGRPISWFQIRR